VPGSVLLVRTEGVGGRRGAFPRGFFAPVWRDAKRGLLAP
jgi:hypothetical protein